MKEEDPVFNALNLVVISTIVVVAGCFVISDAFAIHWVIGATVSAIVAMFAFALVANYRDIAKRLYAPEQFTPENGECASGTDLSKPAENALNLKMDALCKHLGVKCDVA